MIWIFECPLGWKIVQPWGDGYALQQINGGLGVIVDCEEKSDGRKWLHISCSRKAWAPTHDDMALVKEAFVGPDRYAYSIWPPKSHYVNYHPYCLHIWAMMDTEDGRILPEFSAEIDGIGKIV